MSNTLQKLRIPHILKWVSLLGTENHFKPSKSNLYAYGLNSHILQHIRLFRAEKAINLNNVGTGDLCELAKKSRLVRKEAQAALLEYLHSTRSLQFMDAENMSKNSPEFFDRLLGKVKLLYDDEGVEVGRSLVRHLMYFPINEFEPFFESIGLKSCEYSEYLPSKLMFLCDDELLLRNYHVLCNYGCARNRIGKVYKDVREVFRYGEGVLLGKLRAFEGLGLKQSLVVKIVLSSPYLLKGDVNKDFVAVLEKLRNVGIEYDWLEENISETDSCDWKCMLELLCLLSDLGLSDEKLREVLMRHPDILLEDSGRITFCLCGFLLKFGTTESNLQSMFLQFPDISVVKFTNNVYHCYKFLVEIRMEDQEIGRMVRSYPFLLGSCELKKLKSLLGTMNCGMGRLCEFIKDDPFVLKKWVLGLKVDRLPEVNRVAKVREIKTKFLLSLGFEEKSKEMERALKVFRGKGIELQERFDCLVNLGLTREQVIAMLKVSPQILNQTKDVIEMKVNFFVKDLGYKVSDLVTHPALVSYTIERVKLRLSMYKWLTDEGTVRPKLSLSTLLSCSEAIFVRSWVDSHPKGPEFWAKLKKKIYSG